MWRRWPSVAALALVAGVAACGGRPEAAGRSGAGAALAPVDSPPAASTVAPPEPLRPLPGESLGAAVRSPVALRAAPSPSARVLARVGRRTRFHSPTLMAVVRRRGAWVGVVHESLGNGRIGWVRADRVRLLREQWSIVVDLSDRQATLRFKGRPYRSFPVAVGKDSTPTPPGRYGVTDRLSTGAAGSSYGCCVLALSGRQPNVAQEWPGGDRLAIHGTNAPASIGQAASSGCLRASERSMRLLIAKVPLGSRVVLRQ